LWPRGSVFGSQREKDEGGSTEEDFGEAMLAWQKLSRTFFARFGKSCHVFLPLMLAKTVASILGQAVTLLDTLYLIPASFAMVSRK
jgi:hypothetical protein